MKKFLTISAIIILLLVVVRMTIWKPKRETAENTYKRNVVATLLEKGSLVKGIEYKGILHAYPESYAMSAVPARFVKYHVKVGDRVKKDQLIATLERDIPGMKFSPVRIESPSTGYVLSLPILTGAMVPPQNPVAIIGGKERIVDLFVSPEDADEIRNTKNVLVVLPDYEDTVKATLYSVDMAQNPMKGGVNVKVKLNDTKGVPGMIAECVFITDETNDSYIIKTQDILPGNNVAIVENGKIKIQPVNVLFSYRNLSAIEGITSEDTVVVLGEDVCNPGDEVIVEMEENYVK